MRTSYRFGLRKVFTFVILCCVATSLSAAFARQRCAEARAIEEIGSLTKYAYVQVYPVGMEQGGCDGPGFAVIRVKSLAPRWIQDQLSWVGCKVFLRVDNAYLSLKQYDDRVIEHLKVFSSATEIHLHGTAVTEHGIYQLRNALPDTRIVVSKPDYSGVNNPFGD